jgi:hypothetical protein
MYLINVKAIKILEERERDIILFVSRGVYISGK